ncbi:hypothetical protein [Paracoccus sp. MKU1]|uniref:hypothetical protein n=1 Tax=Paracoccus sp. MKU1 TaxID=1745182 RepID=UPI00071943CF|nr:hypothetical protein [Paracoccus sp. MKU1]KRW94255.1 hypothetical protein AQY21_20200 [Paracoccus sp. MKU1]
MAVPRRLPPKVVATPVEGVSILALIGPKQVGKTTVASHLQTEYGFHRVRFADPLKDMAECLGLTREHLDGCRKEEPMEALCGKTPRHVMQTLGTEWRNMIGKNLWANILVSRLAVLPEERRFVVVDDMRFPHELQALNEAFPGRVRVIRITNGQKGRAVVAQWLCRRRWGRLVVRLLGIDMHESEAWWPVLPADAEIENTGTLDQLRDKVHTLLRDSGAVSSNKAQRLSVQRSDT